MTVTADDLIQARRAVLAMSPMSEEALGRVAAAWIEADRNRALRRRTQQCDAALAGVR